MVRQFQKDSGFGFGSSPWLSHAEERREAELARMRRNQQVAAQQQLERELRRAAREQQRLAEERARQDAARLPVPQAPLPPVPVRFEFPPIELQETALPLTNLNSFKLVEKAALWWVSNQTDSLLCLPYCRIERLEYQVRTALRVLGSLRGRALLSDEVGLGKY
jgi:multidrug efflux pump subunit AcrA (membrane-fusion protein)